MHAKEPQLGQPISGSRYIRRYHSPEFRCSHSHERGPIPPGAHAEGGCPRDGELRLRSHRPTISLLRSVVRVPGAEAQARQQLLFELQEHSEASAFLLMVFVFRGIKMVGI